MKAVKYVLSFAGILIVAVGIVMIKKHVDIPALPYICIGVGCGMFGHFFGSVMNDRIMKNNPEAAEKVRIEQDDERNIMLSDKSKAKAYDVMVYVFGALMMALGLMGTDMVAIILLVCAYLFVIGSSIFYRIKLDKEM